MFRSHFATIIAAESLLHLPAVMRFEFVVDC
ncbi:MAG: hypothetical protein JWP89_2782 [Schlesneria sp.]|nr:hypothetical protein [Schlesneria sp.]